MAIGIAKLRSYPHREDLLTVGLIQHGFRILKEERLVRYQSFWEEGFHQ
jgi:hypothetical protein